MPTKGWDPDLKARALEIAERRPIPEASAETGVPPGTIKRWRFEAKGSGTDVAPPRQRGARVYEFRKPGPRRRTEPNRSVRGSGGEPGAPPAPPEAPKPIGRPSKLSDELQGRIAGLIEAGNYVETAVLLVGLTKQTFYEWLKKGRTQKRGKYAAFADAIERAAAEADKRDLERIDTAAGKGVWQAAAWRLERRRPEQFGRGGTGPIPEQPPAASPEDYEAIAAAVAQKILGLIEEISPDVAAQVRERLGRKPDASSGSAVS